MPFRLFCAEVGPSLIACGIFSLGLDDTEVVVIEDAKRFDHVGGGNATVPDQQKIFAIGGVCGAGEIEGAKVNAGEG